MCCGLGLCALGGVYGPIKIMVVALNYVLGLIPFCCGDNNFNCHFRIPQTKKTKYIYLFFILVLMESEP